MFFNSFAFGVFLPIVFLLYWALHRLGYRVQNLLILVASYVFYAWWDWRFLALIGITSLAGYWSGVGLARTSSPTRRRAIVVAVLAVNLGVLGVFKYFNFFASSLVHALSAAGFSLHWTSLKIILPVGISFYTFQSLSYTLDVYRRQMEPTHDIVAFFTYVAFFPQLVAGPIERGAHLLPQFERQRNLDTPAAKDGLRQILCGLIKKVVVADYLGRLVDDIFANYSVQSSGVLILGGVYFAFQIYCDFCGYSDIAIGTGHLFGIRLMRNFATPYFSRDVAEFWRRWHISLSTWFRDYVYIPLGGSRVSGWNRSRNVFVVFLLSGLWHGANWTFVVWGLVHALCYQVLVVLGRTRANLDIVAEDRILPSAADMLRMLATFLLVTLAWVFFRAETITDAVAYLWRMFSCGGLVAQTHRSGLPIVAVLCLVEWIQRRKQHALEITGLPVAARWGVYYALILALVFMGQDRRAFIYFRF